jgi:hypothetical protein
MADFFKDDVIIACDDGTICHISKRDLTEHYRLDSASEEYETVVDLLRKGVQVAAMPTPGAAPSGGGDMMCYLVNLSGLKQENWWNKGDK